MEYAEIRRWLREDRPDLRESLAPVATKMMCDAYTWNAGRVAEEYRMDFVKRYAKEFTEAEEAGEVDTKLFAPGQLAMVKLTQTNPRGFIDFMSKGIDPEHGIKRLRRKFTTMIQVAEQNGIADAKNLLMSKLLNTKQYSKLVDSIDNEMASRKDPKFTDDKVVPKISVILTVYNTADVLRETLDSIFAQSFGEFELICINDGSTDSSLEVLKEYEAKDTRIKIFSQENGGVSKARNAGLAHATAPYVLILDSDDIFRFDMFEKLLKQAEKTNAEIVVCASEEYDGKTYETSPMPWALKTHLIPKGSSFTVDEVADTLFEAFMGWPWDRLYKKELLDRSELKFPEDLKNSEDGVYVYGLLYRAGSISIVDEPLIKHRATRKGSVSNSRENNPECFYDAICRIKADLKACGKYQRLEKSFLNWALDYTIWNITTLNNSATKKALSGKVVRGEYSELEIDKHPWSFFDLYGISNRKGYKKLELLAR